MDDPVADLASYILELLDVMEKAASSAPLELGKKKNVAPEKSKADVDHQHWVSPLW